MNCTTAAATPSAVTGSMASRKALAQRIAAVKSGDEGLVEFEQSRSRGSDQSRVRCSTASRKASRFHDWSLIGLSDQAPICQDYADKAVILNIVHSELYRIIILPINTIINRRYHCFRNYDSLNPDTISSIPKSVTVAQSNRELMKAFAYTK